MPDIQSAIDHIKIAVDVDPWAADMAEKALKKEIPQKWEYDRPGHWRCPACGTYIGLSVYLTKYCLNCGQRLERAVIENDAE